MAEDETLLKLEEVAALTGLPMSTLRYWRLRGEGPPMFRLGRRVVAKRSDVVAWIDAEAQRGSAAA